MRQCRGNFKEEHRYNNKKRKKKKKQQRAKAKGEGNWGLGVGEKRKKKQETMSTFISSVIPHQGIRASILIKTKNINLYAHNEQASRQRLFENFVAIKDK